MRMNLPCRQSRCDRCYESGGIVISHRLGISKGLEDGIGLKNLLLKIVDIFTARCNRREILDDFLCVLCLSGTGFTPFVSLKLKMAT
jgi:hypothetical protein